MEWSGVVALAMVGCALLVAGLGGGVVAADASHTAADRSVVDGHSSDALVFSGTSPEPVPVDRQSVTAGDPTALFGNLEEEFDTTEFRIHVEETGDAVWRFEFRRTLETDDQRQQFDEFAQTFRDTETEFYESFEQQALDLVIAGSAVTDREMEATSFDRSAERRDILGNEFGVVEIKFRWTNFAQTNHAGAVTMGDVFQGQLFIGDDQRLVVEAGENLVFESVQPDGATSAATLADSATVTWEGEQEFLDGRPRAVLHPSDGLNEAADESTGISPMWAVAGLFVVALVVAGGFVIYQRQGTQTQEKTATTADQSSQDATTEVATAATEPTISDEELLTDEDRVVELLESHGGRMKQVNIVEETGWSKSKVSMLLSEMEEEGMLTKIRVGRENIVALDGHEPDMVGSPFDDEE